MVVIKNILEQYTSLINEKEDLKRRINKLENDIDRLNEEGYVKDSVKGGLGGIQVFKVEGFPVTEYEEKVYLLNKRKRELANRELNISELLVEIESYISSISDSRIRMIITYRYIDNLPWQDVAGKLYSKASADSVRIELDRFFKEK